MKYRKKPIVVEAWQFNGEDWLKWPRWLLDYQREDRAVVYWDNNKLYIPTLEGTMVANITDYIIQGLKGEICPCKADIFEASYDPVDEELRNIIKSFDYVPAEFSPEEEN